MTRHFVYLQQSVVEGADMNAVVAEGDRCHEQVLQQVVEQHGQGCRPALDRTLAGARPMESQANKARREIQRLGGCSA